MLSALTVLVEGLGLGNTDETYQALVQTLRQKNFRLHARLQLLEAELEANKREFDGRLHNQSVSFAAVSESLRQARVQAQKSEAFDSALAVHSAALLSIPDFLSRRELAATRETVLECMADCQEPVRGCAGSNTTSGVAAVAHLDPRRRQR
eukprot:5742438-Prymnesium_polylepis.1